VFAAVQVTMRDNNKYIETGFESKSNKVSLHFKMYVTLDF